MNWPRRVESVIAAEQTLLRQLCTSGITTPETEALRRLAQYKWEGRDHQVVFDALLRLANVPPESLRARMPIEATRMGFPDIDWPAFFERPEDYSESEENIARLIANLLAESTGRQ